MIDQKDRDALSKMAVIGIALCLASCFVAVVLGLSIHILRVIGGI